MAAETEKKKRGGDADKREGLGGFRALQELLPAVLQKYGLKGELSESKVFMAWEKIGKSLVGNTWPKRFRKGRFTVEVESSPQLMECVMMKDELLERLNASLEDEKVERLIFKIAAKRKGKC